MVFQKKIILPSFSKGFHLITDYVTQELPKITGVAHVFIQHTSASLTINENADPSVRSDFETFFNRIVPEDIDMYTHVEEGLDDMTSHIKSSLLGSSVSFPIKNGKPKWGIWQGIFLCEHRDHIKKRSITAIINGIND